MNPRPQATPATISGATPPLAAVHSNVKDSRLVNTMPNGAGAPIASDEMGVIARLSSEVDEGQPQPLTEANGPPPRRRSRTGTAVPPSHRFTVTNMTDNEFPDDSPHINAPGSTSVPRSQSPRQNQWPTAEEEKARLYQEAKEKVDRVQGGLDRSESVRVCMLYSVPT